MDLGVHWNIFQNIAKCTINLHRNLISRDISERLLVVIQWNTNYVLWYPFDEADKNTRSRFKMVFGH